MNKDNTDNKQPWYKTGTTWYTTGINVGLKYPIPYWMIILFILVLFYYVTEQNISNTPDISIIVTPTQVRAPPKILPSVANKVSSSVTSINTPLSSTK
jgi:hypothetical protein